MPRHSDVIAVFVIAVLSVAISVGLVSLVWPKPTLIDELSRHGAVEKFRWQIGDRDDRDAAIQHAGTWLLNRERDLPHKATAEAVVLLRTVQGEELPPPYPEPVQPSDPIWEKPAPKPEAPQLDGPWPQFIQADEVFQ